MSKRSLKKHLEPRLEEAKLGKHKVFFVDAAHFVFGSFVGLLWSAVRIFVPSGSGRQRFNVLGALDVLATTLVTVTNTTTITQREVIELLQKLRQTTTLPLTLVLDNARYQRARAVQNAAEALGIELLFLPPYSPNLNLIERLWKWTKKECLRARVLEDFQAFRGAIEECLGEKFKKEKPRLRSLLTLKRFAH